MLTRGLYYYYLNCKRVKCDMIRLQWWKHEGKRLGKKNPTALVQNA